MPGSNPRIRAGGTTIRTRSEAHQNLDVATEGRDVYVEYVPLGGALPFSTVLSLPMALDLVVPRIDAALDGDPDTPTI